MNTDLKVERTIKLNAPIDKVWEALVSPELTKRYMFNCEVTSNWEIGSSIIWEGEFQGYKAYQTGIILEYQEYKQLKYTTFDKQTGLDDIPANHVHVTYLLSEENGWTVFTVITDNFNGDKTRSEHSAAGWDAIVLPKFKALIDSL